MNAVVGIRPRSGRLTIAQHFSAGMQSANKSQARFSGRQNSHIARGFRVFSRPFHGLFRFSSGRTDKSVGYCQSSATRTQLFSGARQPKYFSDASASHLLLARPFKAGNDHDLPFARRVSDAITLRRVSFHCDATRRMIWTEIVSPGLKRPG